MFIFNIYFIYYNLGAIQEKDSIIAEKEQMQKVLLY
jgi:hypothetical protein